MIGCGGSQWLVPRARLTLGTTLMTCTQSLLLSSDIPASQSAVLVGQLCCPDKGRQWCRLSNLSFQIPNDFWVMPAHPALLESLFWFGLIWISWVFYTLTIQGSFLFILNEGGASRDTYFRLCVKPGSKIRTCQCPAKFNWLSPVTLSGTAGHFL